MTDHTAEGRRRAIQPADPWDQPTAPPIAAAERQTVDTAGGYIERQLERLAAHVETLDQALTALGGRLAPILSDPNPTPSSDPSTGREAGHDGASQVSRRLYAYGAAIDYQVDKLDTLAQAVDALRGRVEL